MFENTFLFSKEHLIILVISSIYIYACPKLTKNLLPYSYIVEKIICALFVLTIVLEQMYIMSMGDYNALHSLPIEISKISAYICIAILFFKQYQYFNIFFSWSLVSAIGELIFFPNLDFAYPDIMYFLDICLKFLLIYSNIYMIDVRKFKINSNAIKENIICCLSYFSFIFLLNAITNSKYTYSFSTINLYSVLVFTLITTLIYIPSLILDDDINYTFKKKK